MISQYSTRPAQTVSEDRMTLTAEQWQVIAKAISFVRDLCGETRADEILELIGAKGEKAAHEGTAPAPQ